MGESVIRAGIGVRLDHQINTAAPLDYQLNTGTSLKMGMNAFSHALGKYEHSVIRPNVGVRSLVREDFAGGARSVFQADFMSDKKAVAVVEDNILQAVFLIYPGGGGVKIDAIAGEEQTYVQVASDTTHPDLQAEINKVLDPEKLGKLTRSTIYDINK